MKLRRLATRAYQASQWLQSPTRVLTSISNLQLSTDVTIHMCAQAADPAQLTFGVDPAFTVFSGMV